MTARRSQGGLHRVPGCPGRLSAARLRRACGGAHSRPSAGPTDTALNPFATSRQGIASQMSIDLSMSWNLTQNRRKTFHLNCVPRQAGIEIYFGFNDNWCDDRTCGDLRSRDLGWDWARYAH